MYPFTAVRFDPTISLGNVLAAASFVIAALFAWRDLSWRVRNIETWKSAHEHTSEQRELAMSILSQNGAKLQALIEGQDRRLILLEDQVVGRMNRTH